MLGVPSSLLLHFEVVDLGEEGWEVDAAAAAAPVTHLQQIDHGRNDVAGNHRRHLQRRSSCDVRQRPARLLAKGLQPTALQPLFGSVSCSSPQPPYLLVMEQHLSQEGQGAGADDAVGLLVVA